MRVRFRYDHALTTACPGRARPLAVAADLRACSGALCVPLFHLTHVPDSIDLAYALYEPDGDSIHPDHSVSARMRRQQHGALYSGAALAQAGG